MRCSELLEVKFGPGGGERMSGVMPAGLKSEERAFWSFEGDLFIAFSVS